MRFKELKRLIRISPLNNSSLYHLFRFEMKKNECNKVIDRFVGTKIPSTRYNSPRNLDNHNNTNFIVTFVV